MTTPTIATLQKEIHANAVTKGFYDTPPAVGTQLMLVVSELGEALEAHRKGKWANREYMIERRRELLESVPRGLTDDEFTAECNRIKANTFELHIKDSIEDELADSVIRILDLAESLNINLEWFVLQKMQYNQGRERLHGKAY